MLAPEPLPCIKIYLLVTACTYTTGNKSNEDQRGQLLLSIMYFYQDKGKPLCRYRNTGKEFFLRLVNLPTWNEPYKLFSMVSFQ